MAFLLDFSLDSRKAVEKQLTNISEGNGVAASDALTGELRDEVAKKSVDGIGGREITNASKEFGGGGFGVGTVRVGLAQAGVAEAQTGTGVQDGQAAAAPVQSDVTAAGVFA